MLLVFYFQANSQTLTFKEVLQFYEGNTSTEISDSTASKVFELERSERWSPFNTGIIVLNEPEFIALTVESRCGAGGFCERSVLVSFTHDGKIIDKTLFESAYGDCTFATIRENIFISDSLLIFTYLDQEYKDCNLDNKEEYLKNELQLEYVFIDKGNFEAPIIRYIDTRRKYYIGSTKFLTPGDLTQYTKDELSIIRNEIFASQGYTFDTPKWQQYFSKQVWYKPIDKNVDKYLSMIERHNIKVLLKAEED